MIRVSIQKMAELLNSELETAMSGFEKETRPYMVKYMCIPAYSLLLLIIFLSITFFRKRNLNVLRLVLEMLI